MMMMMSTAFRVVKDAMAAKSPFVCILNPPPSFPNFSLFSQVLSKKKEDGTFLLRNLQDSATHAKGAHCSLTLSVLHGGKVHHFTLEQQDQDGVFYVDGKSTGERNLSQAITYLGSRQPGWITVLEKGVRGIKVMSTAEKQRRKEANALAVQATEKQKQVSVVWWGRVRKREREGGEGEGECVCV